MKETIITNAHTTVYVLLFFPLLHDYNLKNMKMQSVSNIITYKLLK